MLLCTSAFVPGVVAQMRLCALVVVVAVSYSSNIAASLGRRGAWLHSGEVHGCTPLFGRFVFTICLGLAEGVFRFEVRFALMLLDRGAVSHSCCLTQ